MTKWTERPCGRCWNCGKVFTGLKSFFDQSSTCVGMPESVSTYIVVFEYYNGTKHECVILVVQCLYLQECVILVVQCLYKACLIGGQGRQAPMVCRVA